MLVYSVGIKGAPGFDMGTDQQFGSAPNNTTVDMKVLNRFGEASGGRAWEISEAAFGKNMDAVLDTIAAELRSQYSIGYYPAHPMKDGQWHSVRIRMKNPDYVARGRKEYRDTVLPSAPSRGVKGSLVDEPKYTGRTLDDVLRELQAGGLNIVFSSEIVRPTLRVLAEPRSTQPRKILDEILSQHGLQVRSGPGGTLLVVR
jgi:hypothetical protein